MKAISIIAAGLLTVGTLGSAYADDSQQTGAGNAQSQQSLADNGGQTHGRAWRFFHNNNVRNTDPAVAEDPTGSSPVTNLPYGATRGRAPYAQGESY